MRRPEEHQRPECGSDEREEADARHAAEALEDGTLDPDELEGEPSWWDEGSDDET